MWMHFDGLPLFSVSVATASSVASATARCFNHLKLSHLVAIMSLSGVNLVKFVGQLLRIDTRQG
jgi:hypothetical protein